MNMNQTTGPDLIRYSEALEISGFPAAYFTKLVEAEVVTPVYHIWRVRDKRNAIVQETSEDKAKAEAERIGGRAEPIGRAWYRREQILALTAPAAK